MYTQSDEQRYHLILKLSLFALYILLAYDALAIALGYYLGQAGAIRESGNNLVRNVFLVIAIGEMLAIFFIKKAMLTKIFKIGAGELDENSLYKKFLNLTIIITALCASLSTFGLIMVILGEQFEVLLLFAAISLIAYQFFRLRPKDFPEGNP